MKNYLFITILLASIVLSSCNNKGGSSASRIKAVTSSRGGTTNYFYNPDNTISYSLTSEGSKTTYKLTGNTIKEEIADSVRNQFVSSTIFLNKSGLADSSVAQAPQGIFVKTYVHDANGYIIESKDIGGGKLFNASNSIVKDGNQIQANILDSAMQPLVKVFFDYYLDKPNSMGYENYGMTFLGQDSKNLMKSFVQVRNTGDTLRVIGFKYYFDDKGRVSSKVTSARGMVLDSSTVSYY